MENELNKIPEEIENLLFMKDFAELSNYEKQSVREWLTEDTYSKNRELVLRSRKYLANKSLQIVPAPIIKERLRRKIYRQSYRRPVYLHYFRFLSYRVPVYRFALTFILLAFVYFNYDFGNQTIIKFSEKSDTVFVESPVYVRDTVKTTDTVIVQTETPPHTMRRPTSTAYANRLAYDIPMYYGDNVANIIEVTRMQKNGRSCSDDARYMKYLTIVN